MASRIRAGGIGVIASVHLVIRSGHCIGRSSLARLRKQLGEDAADTVLKGASDLQRDRNEELL